SKRDWSSDVCSSDLYILSREPNPVAAMCSYVCSAPCERACRRGDIDRPLAIRAMKRFLVEWHEASGIPDVMPKITPREERVAVRSEEHTSELQSRFD